MEEYTENICGGRTEYYRESVLFGEARSETQTLDIGASNLGLKSLCFWGDLERNTEKPFLRR